MVQKKSLVVAIGITFIVFFAIWILFFTSDLPNVDIVNQLGKDRNKIQSWYSSVDLLSNPNSKQDIEYSQKLEEVEQNWSFSFYNDRVCTIHYSIKFTGDKEESSENMEQKIIQIQEMLESNNFVPTNNSRKETGWEINGFNNSNDSRTVTMTKLNGEIEKTIILSIMDLGVIY